MELAKVLPLLVPLCLVCRVGAFFPSHASMALPATDYTLTELTTEGIVRAVARYFADSNQEQHTSGNLTSLSPLTPSRLFQVHYGGTNI